MLSLLRLGLLGAVMVLAEEFIAFQVYVDQLGEPANLGRKASQIIA